MKPVHQSGSILFVVLGLAAFWLAPRTLLAESSMTTTLCDVYQHPMKYASQMVKLEAQYYRGLHGQELVDENCQKLSINGQTIPPGIDVTTPDEDQVGEAPVHFTLDRNSWGTFSLFLKRVKHGEPVTVTLVGQIRVKRRFHLKAYGGGLAGNGYGVRGIYRAQIVVQSVEHFTTKGDPRAQ